VNSLVTPRLRLEAVSVVNANLLWRIMQGAHLREFQDIPRYTRLEFERRVAQRPKRFNARVLGRFEWLVSLVESGSVIGWVSLRIGEQMRGGAEIGYSLLAPHRGQGYATEAVAALVGATFDETDLGRIEACCVPENAASRRILDRLGFVQTKSQKCGAVVRGHTVDVVIYTLTRERHAQLGSANSMVMPASAKPK
jgi:RimJ/RimL family protein N-acetyltransferase